MFRFKTLFAALAIAVTTPLALSLPAVAQGTTIIVIDRGQIFAASKAGQDIRTKVQAIETQINGELTPTATQLNTEGEAIEAATQGMTPEAMRADTALRTQVENYARKANDFGRKRQIASQELALTERKALIDFNTALIPVLQAVVAEKGANVILDKSTIVYTDEATDVTADVVAKLDAATPTVAVVRQKMPAQQPQQ